MNLKSLLEHYRQHFERALSARLPGEREPQRLHGAMAYASLNGGKRVRPVLVYATGEALGAPLAALDAPACAVELIHAYSLVHDDLPAMDDDDLRRGKPTCHKAYDEATAILAGDALQSLAFEVLATDTVPSVAPSQRLRMIAELAQASGSRGMAGGQAVDMEATGNRLDLASLESMHRMKTGALIRASVRLGALTAGVDASLLERLDTYAEAIGLAFQIRDDILDVEADTATLGKPQGSDANKNKATYTSLLGLQGAKQKARELHHVARSSLDTLDEHADPLRWLADYIVERAY